MKTQSYQELQAGWRWMKDTDPESAAAAKQWVEVHPEEWAEAEHMLYYSEAKYRKQVSLESLEDAEKLHDGSFDAEAFLPEEVRNSIYQDRCWFDRSKYLPEESDEDPFMYLDVKLVEKLKGLTELEREVLFRNVINGESTESIAQDKQCTSRNIRDIRSRALRQLRAGYGKHEGSGYIDKMLIATLAALLIGCGLMALVRLYPWLEYVFGAIALSIFIITFPRIRERETENRLRRHWDSLRKPRREK